MEFGNGVPSFVEHQTGQSPNRKRWICFRNPGALILCMSQRPIRVVCALPTLTSLLWSLTRVCSDEKILDTVWRFEGKRTVNGNARSAGRLFRHWMAAPLYKRAGGYRRSSDCFDHSLCHAVGLSIAQLLAVNLLFSLGPTMCLALCYCDSCVLCHLRYTPRPARHDCYWEIHRSPLRHDYFSGCLIEWFISNDWPFFLPKESYGFWIFPLKK